MCWNNITPPQREIRYAYLKESVQVFYFGAASPCIAKCPSDQHKVSWVPGRYWDSCCAAQSPDYPKQPSNSSLVLTTKTSNLDYTYKLQIVQNMVGSQCPFPHHISGWMIVIYQPFCEIREVPLLSYPLQPTFRWRHLYVTNIQYTHIIYIYVDG